MEQREPKLKLEPKHKGAKISQSLIDRCVNMAHARHGEGIKPLPKCGTWENSFTRGVRGKIHFWYDDPSGNSRVITLETE